jgi:hypothetical protein
MGPGAPLVTGGDLSVSSASILTKTCDKLNYLMRSRLKGGDRRRKTSQENREEASTTEMDIVNET